MRRRTSFVLSVLLVSALLAAPATAQTFADVEGSVHEPAVSALASEGAIAGCTDDRFCPNDRLTRGQIASLLARALGLDVSLPAERSFDDIEDSVHEGAIEALVEAGMTEGCAADAFCPHDSVTRGQLASLLERAVDLPAGSEDRYFDDIDGSVHEDAIESLAEAGVAAGCDLVEYCPSDRLTRAQGATFVARSLELVDRVELAPYDERRAEQDRAEERRAQSAADATAERAVEVARDQVGKPYQYGGNGPDSFDCSGLTRYAWNAAGVELPRSSSDQYAATTRIDRNELRPGDLVFYHQPVSHVAMYIGDGRIVESPNSGNSVRISDTGLSRSDITGYGRVS